RRGEHQHAAWRLRRGAVRPPWTAPAVPRASSARTAWPAKRGGRASAPRPAGGRQPARDAPWRSERMRGGASSGLLRRRRQLAGVERAVAVDVLLVECGGDARTVAFAR